MLQQIIEFMIKAFRLLIVALVFLAIQSCENKTLDQEIEEYCDCQKGVLDRVRDFHECQEIATEISDKYQFDPIAADEIREKIKNCSKMLNEQND